MPNKIDTDVRVIVVVVAVAYSKICASVENAGKKSLSQRGCGEVYLAAIDPPTPTHLQKCNYTHNSAVVVVIVVYCTFAGSNGTNGYG